MRAPVITMTRGGASLSAPLFQAAPRYPEPYRAALDNTASALLLAVALPRPAAYPAQERVPMDAALLLTADPLPSTLTAHNGHSDAALRLRDKAAHAAAVAVYGGDAAVADAAALPSAPCLD